MPGVVVVNPHSGPDETSAADIAAAFPGCRVELVPGRDVTAPVRKALEGEPEFLAVAGGDGTIRCAAGVLAGTGVPLVPVPAGTRNHFAREVGIADLDQASRAGTGVLRHVDLGDVNGEVFVNNACIGMYPHVVRRRKVREKRLPRPVATIAAAWPHIRGLRRFTVTVDGRGYRAWMVFVGNGRYGRSPFDLIERERLDEATLDLRILRADGRLSRLRVLAALVLGRLDRSPMAVCEVRAEVEVVLERDRVDVALDGEVLPLATPLRFRSRPGALSVLVPVRAAGRP